MISVVIPVGPYPANKRWLGEAIRSVARQSVPVDEIVWIDDMAGVGHPEICGACPKCHLSDWRVDEVALQGQRSWTAWGQEKPVIHSWRSPWRLGVAHAFNFGVALAAHDLVFMLGSDDTLEPDCLEKCVEAWEKNQRRDAYYYVGVRYMDTDPEVCQTVPCNAAMVTKGLWRQTGGFPVETASGAPDAAFISRLWAHQPELLRPVADGAPLYNYRSHPETDSGTRGPWQGIILQTRDLLTSAWPNTEWGRKE